MVGLNPNQIPQKTIITSRRLSSWLLSDWHHKTKKMGLSLPFEPVRCGLFYSLRLGGIWVSADYWIHYFKAKSCTHVVRLEHLEEDSNRIVVPLLATKINCLNFPTSNANNYKRKIERFFSGADLKRIYQNNPAWTSWEEEVYGSLSSIKPIERIIGKLTP